MIELRGITWEHARGHGSVAAASAAYRAVRGDVHVTWEVRSLQAFADHPIERMVADFDLLVIDHPHVPLAAEAGLLARLDGRGHDDELAQRAVETVGRSHESYRHDGHQYGLATDAAAQVAMYRPDLIAEPPRDWNAVLELAEAGRVLWPAKPIDAFSSLVTVAANAGHPPMTEGRFLPEEHTLQAMELLHRLAQRTPRAGLGWNPIQAADALASGDRFAYCPLAFGYTNYSRVGFREHRLAYVDIPAGPAGVTGSLLGGAGIAVSASAGHLDAAVDFAFWLDTPDVQRGVYFDGGGQPGNAVAWDDDRTNDETLDFFRNTRATLEGAYVRPRTASFIALQDSASPLVTAALAGELSDTDLVARLDELSEQALAAA